MTKEDYLIDLVFANKGEPGAIAITAEALNLLVEKINESLQKVVHIQANETSTTFEGRVFANGKEVVTTNKTESEDI